MMPEQAVRRMEKDAEFARTHRSNLAAQRRWARDCPGQMQRVYQAIRANNNVDPRIPSLDELDGELKEMLLGVAYRIWDQAAD